MDYVRIREKRSLMFRLLSLILILVNSTFVFGLFDLERSEPDVEASQTPVMQAGKPSLKLLQREEPLSVNESFPVVISLLQGGTVAPTPYPFGEVIRIATPGVPFYGVVMETGFVCVIPGETWVDCYVNESMATWEVYSPMAGVVTFSENIWPYGNLAVIENSGFQVFLAHNKANLVAVGDVVQAGDLVAMAGNTGKSYGPHVHLEVRQCDMATGVCGVVDPRTVFLPGQTEACSWDLGITKTVQRLGREYTCGWGIPSYRSSVP
jgi:hypothetical protein